MHHNNIFLSLNRQMRAIEQILEVDDIGKLPISKEAKSYYRTTGLKNMHKLPGKYVKMVKKLTNEPGDMMKVRTVGQVAKV